MIDPCYFHHDNHDESPALPLPGSSSVASGQWPSISLGYTMIFAHFFSLGEEAEPPLNHHELTHQSRCLIVQAQLVHGSSLLQQTHLTMLKKSELLHDCLVY